MDFPHAGSREQRTLCREHINRNTVHTLFYRAGGVVGGVRTRIGNCWATLCHSLYSTVTKSTTIPGSKIGLLMFACHSRSVCSACVNALMTYPVCANRVRRGMQIHTSAGHIIRISSKSWFISLIPFKKLNLYNVYIHSTQTDIFQAFISFNFDDYNWQLMKTPNSVSQKIRILWKGSILKTPGATL